MVKAAAIGDTRMANVGPLGTICFRVRQQVVREPNEDDDGVSTVVDGIKCLHGDTTYECRLAVPISFAPDDDDEVLHTAATDVLDKVIHEVLAKEPDTKKARELALEVLKQAPKLVVAVAKAMLGTAKDFDSNSVRRSATCIWVAIDDHLKLIANNLTDVFFDRPHPLEEFHSLGEYITLHLDDDEATGLYNAIFYGKHWSGIVFDHTFGANPRDAILVELKDALAERMKHIPASSPI